MSLLTLFADEAAVFVPTIWVDSSALNDDGSGLTSAAPKKTLSAALSLVGNGSRVGLVAGSEWRESLNVSAYSNVVVGVVGSVSANGLPVIRGDDVMAGAWTDSAGRADANTNVYSRTWTYETATFLNFWENDVRLAWVTSLALCQSTPGSFYMAEAAWETSGTSGTLYIHPPGSTNPNTNGKTYEGTKRRYGVLLGSSSTVRGVYGRRCGDNNGAISGGFDCTIDRCIADGGLRHQILLASGTQRQCIGIREAVDARETGEIVLEFYTPDGRGKSCLWDQCVALNLAGGLVNGFSGHTNGINFYDSWEARDCGVKYASIGGNDVEQLTITRPRIKSGRINPTLKGAGPGGLSITDAYITLESDGLRNVAASSEFILPLGSKNCSINGLRFYAGNQWNMPSSDGVVRSSNALFTGTLSMTRSVIVDNAGEDAARRLVSFSATYNSDFSGNVLSVGGAAVVNNWMVSRNAGAAVVTADNNVYYSAGSLRYLVNGVTHTSTSAYFTAVRPSIEAGSVSTNPSVTDPANGDFSLSGSGLPANCGLERPTVSYIAIPDTLADAIDWIKARL